MDAVEYALWLVESRLDEDLTLTRVAREAGLSPFYLTRRFADETGMTLAAYVRSRRLGEAATAPLSGAPSILDVAVAAGYGSHEAFTRAFRAEFGLTPEQVRARGQEQPLAIRQPVRFQRHLHHIDRSTVEAAYGIVRLAAPGPGADDSGEHEVSVEYSSVLPVSSGLQARDGLVTVTVPQLRVARFEHDGHISGIHTATATAFEAVAAAGLRPAEDYELIERYGPQFDPRTGHGPVGLLLPVAS